MSQAAADLWLLLAALGLALPLNRAGLPLAGQGAFVAVGAYGTALVAPHAPLLVAALAGVALGAVAGALLAAVASRLDGQGFALAAWSAAWLAYVVASDVPSLAGGRLVPTTVESPSLGVRVHLGPGVHVVTASVLCALVLAVTWRAGRGPAGPEHALLREAPELAGSLGVPVARRRATLVVAAAAVAAISGTGTLLLQGVVAPGDVTPLLSLDLFAAVLIGGSWLFGPLVGIGLVLLLPTASSHLVDVTGGNPQTVHALLTALLLVAAVAVRGLVRDRPGRSAPLGPGSAAVTPRSLAARNISVRFDGVQALDGVDLDVRPGQVHALIGPNGSGKTTLLRVLAGDLRPDLGTVTVDGADVTSRPAWQRVRLGVGRTPQQTVEVAGPHSAQLRAAARASDPPWSAARHLLGGRSAVATTRARDARAGATAVAEARDGTTLRLLQVARTAATGAGAVLLDEPAAGVGEGERSRVAAAVRALADEGRAVLLVEHDLRLVGAVADHVTVLSEGRVLAAGTMDEVRADPAVIAAYLGAPTLHP